MNIRDQLAMAALQGELAAQSEEFSWASEQHLAARAYEIADAMLVEREKSTVANAPQEWIFIDEQKPKDGQNCLVVLEVWHSKDESYRYLDIDQFNDGGFDSIANYENQANSVALPAGSSVSKLKAICWVPFDLSNKPIVSDEFLVKPQEQNP